MKKLILALALVASCCVFAKDDFFPPIQPRNSANLFSYDATKFGFQENLRTNQVIKGTKLVDQIVSLRNARAQVVKAGDFQYVVSGFVVDKKLDIKAFGAVSATADAAALVAALEAYETSGTIPTVAPSCDRVVFVAYKGKTFTLFKNAE